MRKFGVPAVMCALLAGMVALVGCGGSVSTGKMPTEAELGVPIYPNAKMDENSQLAFQDTKVAVMWTEDASDKVIAWYRDKLRGKPGYNAIDTSQIGQNATLFTFTSPDNEVKMVTVGFGQGDHPGKTSIDIGSGSMD